MGSSGVSWWLTNSTISRVSRTFLRCFSVSLINLATVCVKSPSRVIGLMIWQLMKQVFLCCYLSSVIVVLPAIMSWTVTLNYYYVTYLIHNINMLLSDIVSIHCLKLMK